MCRRYLFSTQKYKKFRQIARNAQRRSNDQHDKLNFPIADDIAPNSEVPALIASSDKSWLNFSDVASPAGAAV